MRSIHAAVVAAALAGLSVSGCTHYEPERVTERVVYVQQAQPIAPVSKPIPADESAAKPMPGDAPQGYVYGPPAPRQVEAPRTAPVYEMPPAGPVYQPAPSAVVEQPAEYPPMATQSTTVIEREVYVDRPVYVESPVYQPYPVYVGYRGWYGQDHCDDRWYDHRPTHHDNDQRNDNHHIVNTHPGPVSNVPTLKKEYPTTPDSGQITPLVSPPTPTEAKQTIPIKPAKGGAPVVPAPQKNNPSFHHIPAPAPKPAPVAPKAPVTPKQPKQIDSGKNSKSSDSKSSQQDSQLPPKFRRN